MKSSDTLNMLAPAMVKLQAEITDPGKDKDGYDKRYSYADLGSILKILRPLAAKHGLAFIQLPVGDNANGLTTRILHESGQWIEDTFYIPRQEQKGLSTAQTVGVIITYARRYAITAAFGMAQIDNDAALEDMKRELIRGTAEAIREALVEDDQHTSETVVTELNSLSQEDQELMFSKTLKSGGYLHSAEKASVRSINHEYIEQVKGYKEKILALSDHSEIVEAWAELTGTQNTIMNNMMSKDERQHVKIAMREKAA